MASKKVRPCPRLLSWHSQGLQAAALFQNGPGSYPALEVRGFMYIETERVLSRTCLCFQVRMGSRSWEPLKSIWLRGQRNARRHCFLQRFVKSIRSGERWGYTAIWKHVEEKCDMRTFPLAHDITRSTPPPCSKSRFPKLWLLVLAFSTLFKISPVKRR